MNAKQKEILKYITWAIGDLAQDDYGAVERDLRWASNILRVKK